MPFNAPYEQKQADPILLESLSCRASSCASLMNPILSCFCNTLLIMGRSRADGIDEGQSLSR